VLSVRKGLQRTVRVTNAKAFPRDVAENMEIGRMGETT
jgi:hypothetical protein